MTPYGVHVYLLVELFVVRLRPTAHIHSAHKYVCLCCPVLTRCAAAAFQGKFPQNYGSGIWHDGEVKINIADAKSAQTDTKTNAQAQTSQTQTMTTSATSIEMSIPTSISKASPFHKLGRDPLLYVFFVLGATHLPTLALVCKQFAQSARSEGLWHRWWRHYTGLFVYGCLDE